MEKDQNTSKKGFMMSCKDATYMATVREDVKFSLGQKLKLGVHLSSCPPCKRFVIQTRSLVKSMRTYGHRLENLPPHSLTGKQRLRLENEINRFNQESS